MSIEHLCLFVLILRFCVGASPIEYYTVNKSYSTIDQFFCFRKEFWSVNCIEEDAEECYIKNIIEFVCSNYLDHASVSECVNLECLDYGGYKIDQLSQMTASDWI